MLNEIIRQKGKNLSVRNHPFKYILNDIYII